MMLWATFSDHVHTFMETVFDVMLFEEHNSKFEVLN